MRLKENLVNAAIGTVPIKEAQMEFKVSVRKGEDGWYVVNCPALKGCWSQGKTVEEALESIKDAIEGYLEVQNEVTTTTVKNAESKEYKVAVNV